MRPCTTIGSLSLVCVLVSFAAAPDDAARPALDPSAPDCDANGAGDADEIAADAVLDANFNGIPDRCEGLSVDCLEISVSAGGTQTFTLDLGPGMAGQVYWILGTTAGTDPGMKFGFTHLPLNDDGAYLRQTLLRPNVGNLHNTVSALDMSGRATASASLDPDSDPALAGIVVHHAFVLVELTGRFALWASNTVSLELVP